MGVTRGLRLADVDLGAVISFPWNACGGYRGNISFSSPFLYIGGGVAECCGMLKVAPVVGVLGTGVDGVGGAALMKLDVDFLVFSEMASYGVRSGDS